MFSTLSFLNAAGIARFPVEEVWIGGSFCDGRASGRRLGGPLAEQAPGAFLNPVKQNLPDTKEVYKRIAGSSYKNLFEQVW